LNVNSRVACDFFIGNGIKYNREYVAEALRQQPAKNLHGINVKRADLGGFDGQVCAEYSPAHRFTVFSKARGVIIDARSDCAQR
jgi:hypothetical protein